MLFWFKVILDTWYFKLLGQIIDSIIGSLIVGTLTPEARYLW